MTKPNFKPLQNIQSSVPDIFTPAQVGRYELANRAVMAPLTRNRAGEGGVPRAMNVEYYRQRASAGLIITEGSPISAQGVGYPGTPGIYTSEQVAGWKRVTDAVHDEGGRIFLQLWHVGRISHPSLQPDGELPVAPSAIQPMGEAFTADGLKPFPTPRALETDEIADVVTQFRTAAENALEAGFDGVEVHAANGYLLDQFLRDGSNHRTDRYGGSLENRVRLLLEVTEAVVEVWGADRVGVRFSPVNGFNDIRDSAPDVTFPYAASRLNRFGLAYLHVVEASFVGEEHPRTFDKAKLRRVFKGAYMANGGYGHQTAETALAAGAADVIAFGTPFLANPDLVERFALGAALNEPDPETFYGGDERGDLDYPFLGDPVTAVTATAA
mgnify:CR=1 FL=1